MYSFAEREREKRQWAVYFTSPKKFYINVFLFVGLTTSTEEVILYIIIGDVHKFIGHCLSLHIPELYIEQG